MSNSAKKQNALFALFEAGEPLALDVLSEHSGIRYHETIKTAGYLVNRGYLARLENGVFALTFNGAEARKKGVVIKSGPMGPDTGKGRVPFKNTIRQRAWSAMRIMVVFSITDLVAVASDDPTEQDHVNIRRYCLALCKAQILMEMPTRQRGAAETSNGFKRYRLFDDLGEIAPTYRGSKSEVFDHNSREVMPCLA